MFILIIGARFLPELKYTRKEILKSLSEEAIQLLLLSAVPANINCIENCDEFYESDINTDSDYFVVCTLYFYPYLTDTFTH